MSTRTVQGISPAEYGRRLAETTPPITDEQAEAAARIFIEIAERTAAPGAVA